MTNKEAIYIINNRLNTYYCTDEDLEALNLAIKALEKAQGKWIDTGYMEEYWAEEYQCSICGAKDHWHKYCPNCGAYMGKTESEDYMGDKA